MKTVLAVIGAIALAIIALIIVVVVRAVLTLGPLLKEAQAYVDTAVPAIASKWDREELIKRGTPLLVASATPEAVEPLFSQMRSLGTMTKYENATCSSLVQRATAGGAIVEATCQASAQFERGSAAFALGLVKAKGEWRINGFFFRGYRTSDEEAPVMAFGLGERVESKASLMTWPWAPNFNLGALQRFFEGTQRPTK